MIEIVYYRSKHKVTVTGHAKSGDVGKDLVCAAASILAYTLASNVTNLCDCDKHYYRRKKITLNPGDAVIACSPIRRAGKVATLIFDTVCAGFELLGRNYPEYVKYTRI